jgi:hypothetical protein
MKYINIEVKKEDIDKSVKADKHNCPVANAIKRQFLLPSTSVSVQPHRIRVGQKYYRPSQNLFDMIFDYDCRTEPFKPGTYRAYTNED